MLLIPGTTVWELLAVFLVSSGQTGTLAPSHIIYLSRGRVLQAFDLFDV